MLRQNKKRLSEVWLIHHVPDRLRCGKTIPLGRGEGYRLLSLAFI